MGWEFVGKKGIVRDFKVYVDVFKWIISFFVVEGYICKGLLFLLIIGGDGNIEFFFYLYWLGEG